ncbi:hypothetical protein LCGC14_2184540 [marine sediment metagenome]|uniref:Uncharacterized protein n=1 Tax=marine sediment metagenome TaxID=412755 RepID=A0A0F9DLE9_9ZZZZ
MPPQNPLTEQDLEDLNKALDDSRDADSLIQQAQQAGLDVEAFRVRNREARERLGRIKQTFFPGK